MCKPQRLLMFIVALLGLSSCQSVPNDISELIGSKQSASVWVLPGAKFELKGTPSVQTYASQSSVTVEYEKGGRWMWSAQPSIRIDSKSGSARVKLPSDLFENPGKIVSAADTGQDYGIRLIRSLKPTRQWVTSRKEDVAVYREYDENGNFVHTLSHYETTHFEDHYMDGHIEYQLAFYDRESKLVAAVYIKKPVTNFLERSERT